MGSTGYWEIRTYECGALGEKTKYWVPGEPPARGRKLGRSSERKQRQNENDAARRLNREIHANFSAGDLFLGLDYGPKKYSELLRRAEARQEADRAAGQEPGILEDYLRKEANRELDNFIRRVKRRLPPGAELKYIAVTSDMDGETGEAVRIHHHIISSTRSRKRKTSRRSQSRNRPRGFRAARGSRLTTRAGAGPCAG